jgi:hypothetical protein
MTDNMIRCPVCNTWEFDINEDLDTGYCTSSCGAIFFIHDDSSVTENPFAKVIVPNKYDEVKRLIN